MLWNIISEDSFGYELGVLKGDDPKPEDAGIADGYAKLVGFLDKRGFRNVGTGSFSAAYLRDNVVVKINHLTDDCSHEYAKFCHDHYHSNVFLPVVYDVFYYTEGHRKWTVIVMERLERIEYGPMYELADDYFLSLDGRFSRQMTRKQKENAITFESENKKFCYTLDHIIKKFDNCIYDMSMGNMLKRPSTGELVIADPIAPVHAHA